MDDSLGVLSFGFYFFCLCNPSCRALSVEKVGGIAISTRVWFVSARGWMSYVRAPSSIITLCTNFSSYSVLGRLPGNMDSDSSGLDDLISFLLFRFRFAKSSVLERI
jgi:hypothetical protein